MKLSRILVACLSFATISTVHAESATTADEARKIFQASVDKRKAKCLSRGTAYYWVAPYKAGDSDGEGGFRLKNSNGACKQYTLTEAVKRGIVVYVKK